MLIITVTFKLKPAHQAAFHQAILDNARASLENEAGCLRFDVCASADGSEVFLYEQYVDDHAFDTLHLQAAHFLAFNDMTRDWVDHKQVQRYRLLA